MKYLSIILLVCNILLSNNFCLSERSKPYYPNINRDDPAIIKAKLYVHIIKDSQGNGQLDADNLENGFNILFDNYNQLNILFEIAEQDTIYSDFFHNTGFITARDSLLYSRFHQDGIDIYIGREDEQGIGYSFFPLTAVALRGSSDDNYSVSGHYVVAHEVGHILGLVHTHQGNSQGDGPEYKEKVVRLDENDCYANCDSTADHFCDTPSDPVLILTVNQDCIYCSDYTDPCGYSYTPNGYNIMSYTHMLCGLSLSESQKDLAIYTIQNESDISDTIISLTNIIGDFNVDQTLNILDIVMLVNFILSDENPSSYQIEMMDFNNDLLVDIVDIINLIQIIFNN